MKLQQLRYFCQVVKHDFNISSAAQAIYTSQPGVSKQLKLLEQELGVELFVRNNGRIVGLSEAGVELHEEAQRVLMSAAQLHEVARNFTDTEAGRLTVATTHLHARYSLLPVIKRFAVKYPKVQLDLIQTSPAEIDALLTEGAADIGISTGSNNPSEDLIMLKSQPLYRCLIAPQGHPILAIARPSLKQIAGYPLIVYSSQLSSGWLVKEAFESAGVQTRIVLTALDADVIKAYVAAGLGIAIIQRLAYDPQKDVELGAVDVTHLVRPVYSLLILNRAKYLRRYMFDFIQAFEPKWKASAVRRALAAHR